MKIKYNNLSFNVEQFARIFAESFLEANSREALLDLKEFELTKKIIEELKNISIKLFIDNIPGNEYFNNDSTELMIVISLIFSKMFLITLEKTK